MSTVSFMCVRVVFISLILLRCFLLFVCLMFVRLVVMCLRLVVSES